ncbi:hypothetical protein BCR44DRAFT_1437339 [Catenaria anguillulae PL171]|uniref:DUF1636 domain-containing protein n=1 Tax=Catenaria anguillulae PL171 TaxID=765915 RepID=A0A1Y2HH73_9FUNG|nr:hypothetical protein BCR44DRAFT_1437339 [Catenaria anguillulae PL171]
MGIVVDLLCPCTHSLARWFPPGTFSAPLTWGDPNTALLRLTLSCYPVTIVLVLLAAKSWLVRARARRLHRLAQAAGSVAAVLDVSSPSCSSSSSSSSSAAWHAPVSADAAAAGTDAHAQAGNQPPPALLVCTKCHDSRRAPAPANNPDRKRTGELLYDSLASASHPTLAPLVSAGKLQILPVKCLANCDGANCIALSAYDKFTYQFTGLCATDEQDIEDIASFAGYYATGRYCAGQDEVLGVEDAVAMTKVKTRPRGLKSNCVARIPPLVGPGRDLLLGSAPRLPPAPIEESELEVGKEPAGEPEVAIALEEVHQECTEVTHVLLPTPPDSQVLALPPPPPQQPVHPPRSRSVSASPCAPSNTAASDDGFRLVRPRRRRRARTPARKANAQASPALPSW